MNVIIWFREDLRVHDNTALAHATTEHTSVIGVYIIDADMWPAHDTAACRVDFILRGLHALRTQLRRYHIPLLIKTITPQETIPQVLFTLIQELSANTLYFNKQYELNEQRRDTAIIDYLQQHHIQCYSYDDQVILAPGTVLNNAGDYFKIFTPFKRAWQKVFYTRESLQLLPLPQKQPPLPIMETTIPTSIVGFENTVDRNLWPAGEQAAMQRLEKFIEQHLYDYDKQRDVPALSATSMLSPYLASGMISVRQCLLAALSANHYQLDSGNKGALTWINELIWREFYKHILAAVPRVCMHQPYNLNTQHITWNFNPEYLTAWQQGMTGYPIIDAAMRQLNTIGWMHNRLRMIVAMFFSKNLFFDWRIGERYFMQHLIDGDLAANNGGWQWCASTGTDAAPYFRIFNPVTQGQRFDPQGDFIRQYCPELAEFPAKAIHDPHRYASAWATQVGYPQPIVDLTASRRHAIAAFKNIK